ncbi:BON1-associated protein [Arachis hypogaea]|nr:BON1-associated protein [Arachis hypogaea]
MLQTTTLRESQIGCRCSVACKFHNVGGEVQDFEGCQDVGIARVAVSEFMGGFGSVPQHCLQFLSYRLRDWEGRRNGVLNFSVRVVNSPEYVTAAAGKAVSPCGFKLRGTTMGATTSSSSCGGGVVVGVPIGWNSYGSSTYNNV